LCPGCAQQHPSRNLTNEEEYRISTPKTTRTTTAIKMGPRDHKDILPTMASTPAPPHKSAKKILEMQSEKEWNVYSPPLSSTPEEMGKKESFSSGLSLPAFPKWPWPGRPGNATDVLPTFVTRRTSALGNLAGLAAKSPYPARNDHWDIGTKETVMTGQDLRTPLSQDKANDLGRLIMKTIPVVALLLLAGLAVGGLIIRLFL
jgi:hypothetical protein